ncbi:unnamed protein product [Parnassius apollo]|uniref:(apollo) hypothetical protein n=1 Tax=Parnassius apollo TaxID=110799 RepID=A0A8S3WT52_PARAO|nr:unnamed protein product [Parnassius apollo]
MEWHVPSFGEVISAACNSKIDDDCLGDKIDGEAQLSLAGDEYSCKAGALCVISSISSLLSDKRFRSNKDDGKDGGGELLSERVGGIYLSNSSAESSLLPTSDLAPDFGTRARILRGLFCC